uniref:Uncharacterized protein n=1 Tax=Arundo donax TaxID=35708 RepID=A0A0A9CQL5_ARUDO
MLPALKTNMNLPCNINVRWLLLRSLRGNYIIMYRLDERKSNKDVVHLSLHKPPWAGGVHRWRLHYRHPLPLICRSPRLVNILLLRSCSKVGAVECHC